MKNLIKFSLLTFLMAFTFSSFAQSPTFGGRIGVNLATANFDNNELPESKTKLGITIALLGNFSITEAFSIQPELHFIQKGFKNETTIVGTKYENTLKSNYLDLPLLAKYQFGGIIIKGHVVAGPVFGYALNAESESCEGETCDTDKIDFDDTDGFKRFDAGIAFGAGASYGNVFIDVRYVLGLTDFTDTSFAKGTNRGVQVGLGYIFELD